MPTRSPTAALRRWSERSHPYGGARTAHGQGRMAGMDSTAFDVPGVTWTPVSDKLIGVLQTSWFASGRVCRALLDAPGCGDEEARQVAASFRVVAEQASRM